MVFTKGNCGEGMETCEWEREEGGGGGSVTVSSTRGEGREERAVSGLVQVPPQCWDSGVSVGRGWGGVKGEKEETG